MWIAGLALLPMSAPAWAQGQPAPVARSSRIGVIDLDRVWTETQLGKAYAVRLDKLQSDLRTEGAKRQSELEKLDADIGTQREQLIKEQPVLSQDAVEERQQRIDRLMRQRETRRQDSEEHLARMQRLAQREAETLQADLRRQVAGPIEGLVKDLGLDVVLDIRVCVATSSNVDVTAEVVRRADAAFKEGTMKPLADKPAAEPATAATTKPPARK
jgi:Skp family chaperone for outer membrane proteins